LKRAEAATPITLVGLDDEWSDSSGRRPRLRNVSGQRTHDLPDTIRANVKELLKYPWQMDAQRHTHGRQLAGSKFGREPSIPKNSGTTRMDIMKWMAGISTSTAG